MQTMDGRRRPRVARVFSWALNYRLVEATSAREGLALAASRNPDVILLDLGLPDRDGLDVARELRGWSAVPIIVLSARGREQDKVAALLACRVLDEGVDVPEIDAALLVASTQSKRQRIQRIGRALRRGDGQKRPLIITLFVPETNDRNVTQEDASVFGSAAKIHRVTEEDCLPTIRALLARR